MDKEIISIEPEIDKSPKLYVKRIFIMIILILFLFNSFAGYFGR